MILLIAGVVLVPTFVALGALRAKGASAASQWGLWVSAASLVVGAIGAAVPLWDRLVGSPRRAEASADDAGNAEDELAKVVLGQARVARSRLVGAGEAGDTAANVRFVKGTGRFREVGGASEGDLDTVLEYYQSLSPRRLVILGEPGAGKTVLAMELLVALLERRKQDQSLPVPVLVSAAAYDTTRPWEEWLGGHLAQRFNMGAQAAAGLVRDRRVLPVVDGLDEMDPAGEPERARTLVAALNSFMQDRERAAVVVTCRREEYQVLAPGVDKATHIEMVPLDGHEAADYFAGQLRGAEEEQAWEPVLTCLGADPGGPLAAQLATPWRLTLALTVFRDGGRPAELLPGPSLDRYAQRVNTLLLDRYVPSAVRLYDPSGDHVPGQVERFLTALAKDLDWQARNNGSATDIELDEWWRPAGRWTTRITNCALFAVIAVPYLLIAAISGNYIWAVAGGCLVMVSLFAATDPIPSRVKAQQLTTRRGLRQIAVWTAGWLGVGLVGGLVAWLVTGLVAWLGGGLVVGLGGGLASGLAAGLDDASPQAIGPRDVVRADRQYGLMFGLVGGLMFGLGGWLVFGLAVGLGYGLAAWLAVFGVGAQAWIRYHIAVAIAALPPRSGPLRFSAALEWAYQAGLLRLSGVAYQFRHRQLQDWLRSGQ